MHMADETGLSRGQLIEIIEMLQIALRHAGAQTKTAARMGWGLFEGEQDTAAFHRHELSLAQWKYSRDVVYEDDPPGRVDPPKPVLPVRVATPQPSGFREESYEWARYMSLEDLTLLHARLSHSSANFSRREDMDCLIPMEHSSWWPE